MDDTEDNWVREFGVSNPQKTHAGYTVYRVSSKLYPKGSPEAASEVIVFKRYSEIRKLYKELKIIYESKDNQVKKFPHFSKANFFSRFDESVIEERQRQALLLLSFAGNIFFLFTSQPFVHFFEGGVEHGGSSRCSSNSSDQHQSHPEGATQPDVEPWTPQTYFNPDLNSSDEDAIESNEDLSDPRLVLYSTYMDSAKKKWLARAMSLCSEGDDIEILASEAGYNGKEFGGEVFDSGGEGKGKVGHGSHPSQGSVDLLPILLESSGEDEDVFVAIGTTTLDEVGSQACVNTAETSQAYEHDAVAAVENIAGSLGDVKFDNDWKPFEEHSSDKLAKYEMGSEVTDNNTNEEILGKNRISCETREHNGPDRIAGATREHDRTGGETREHDRGGDETREHNRADRIAGATWEHDRTSDETWELNRTGGETREHDGTSEIKGNDKTDEIRENSRTDGTMTNNIIGITRENSKMNETRGNDRMDTTMTNNRMSETCENDKMGTTIKNDRIGDIRENNRTDEMRENNRGNTENDFMQEVNMKKNEELKTVERGEVDRNVSNIGVSWIDPKKKDYLYQAAQIIQQALYCEANEFYEEAFNKYKMCVGILLKGVQHDGNCKRREAVRRKTAQYLVKAEFLFNTYLKEDQDGNKDDWPSKSSNCSGYAILHDIVDRRFHQLTLHSLKVIGIIKKVMLVQCEGLEGVFVSKVLHKTNAVHRNAKQESKQTNKCHSKKYVKSCHMVKLHQHFDTRNSIFLLLEYASGGALWDQIRRKRHVVHDVLQSRDQPCDVTQQTEHAGKHIKPNTTEDKTLCEKDKRDNFVSLNNPCDSQPQFVPNDFDKTKTTPTNTLSSTTHNSNEKLTMMLQDGDDLSENFTNQTDTSEPSRKTNDIVRAEDFSNAETFPKLKSADNINTGHTSHDALGYLDHVACDDVLYEECVQRWIAELLLAIASVHSCGIILKDLKPSNVLLDDSGHVMLTYFGVWEDVDHSVDLEAVEKLYCAPEISCGEKITIASDWWSLGVLSYELITGKSLCSTHPWGIHLHSSISFPTESISPEACSFLKGLICHNPSERLGSGMAGIEEIKSHAFFKEVDWDELSKHS